MATGVYGQRFSFGVVGGTNVTNNFPVTYSYAPGFVGETFTQPPSEFWYQSGPRSFILGASMEAYFNDWFSLEMNVLHRPLKSRIKYDVYFPEGTQTTDYTLTAVRAWEFPVLFKYTIPVSHRIRPFLTVGPSFRTQEDAGAAEPSQVGFSAGAGVTIPWGRFRISPTLRYTRWARESVWPRYATKPDQLEFLTSLSYEMTPEFRTVKGRKIEIGALFGVGLTDGILGGWREENPEYEERFRYLAGVVLQTKIRGNWAVEANALYRPIRVKGVNPDRKTLYSVLTWQFPVLVKYSFTDAKWRPFVAGGPSFRLSGNLNGYNPSHFGATAGAGVESLVGRGIRLAPAIRYTRWKADDYSFPRDTRTNPNSVELVFGVTF